MAITNIKDKKVLLKYISFIYNLVWFYYNKIQILLNNKNKINIMNLVYIQKLGFKI